MCVGVYPFISVHFQSHIWLADNIRLFILHWQLSLYKIHLRGALEDDTWHRWRCGCHGRHERISILDAVLPFLSLILSISLCVRYELIFKHTVSRKIHHKLNVPTDRSIAVIIASRTFLFGLMWHYRLRTLVWWSGELRSLAKLRK